MRIIIIGGLSAGPSAAAKARRTHEEAEILLFEKTSFVSYATCGIPYALSGKIKDRQKLLVVEEKLLQQRFNIDTHLNEPVIEILPDNKKIRTAKGTYAYDKLIYAAGTRSFTPPIRNLEMTQDWSHARTIEDFDRLMGANAMVQKERITIVGGGLIGVEVAENLTHAGKKVTLVELGNHILPQWDPRFAFFAEKELERNGITVITNAKIDSVKVDGDSLREVHLRTGKSWNTDYLIFAIGGRPNTELLAQKGAATLGNGALIVNEKMETSLPDIYAAGDCASIKNLITGVAAYFPMGTHSNKGGRVAGENAVGGNAAFKGAYGSGIVTFFGSVLARTGMNTQTLLANQIPFKSTFLIGAATPGFYPDPKDMYLEIHYNPDTKVILGAEIYGEKGVDKRIDVLSTAIYAQLTLDDLENLDLAYAPPFSTAKDPVVMAGFIAKNGLKGSYQEIYPEKLSQIIPHKQPDQIILDVRKPAELEQQGRIPGAINIELDEIRHHLDKLNPDASYFIYCARGLRGYLASLILAHHGFRNINNLAGGFFHWRKAGYAIERIQEAVPGMA